MIDFRYHLISIVAVLLALSSGVVLGSGVLGGPLLDDVRQRAEDVRKTNEEVRDLADERLQTIDRYRAFMESSSSYLLDGALDGVNVVLVTADGTDQDIVESLTGVVESAGGEVASTLRFTSRFVLDDEIAVDQLALAIGSVESEPAGLRTEAGRVLGSRLGAAASSADGTDEDRLTQLLDTLSGSDFLAVQTSDDDQLTTGERVFLVAAGGPDDPPFPPTDLMTAFVRALSLRDVVVMVGEPTGSGWDLIGGDFGNVDAREAVSTVGGIEDLPGQMAAVLGLARALEEGPLHVGFGEGADMVIPSPVVTQPETEPTA